MRYEIVFAPAAVQDERRHEYRIFYDVVEDAVEIIAILPESRAYGGRDRQRRVA